MLPTQMMSFMKKMVTPGEETVPPPGVPYTATESGTTFGKLRQTLSSSLLTAQDKVTKLGPRPGTAPADVTLPEPAPPTPTPTPPPPIKIEREAGKPASRVGACRVCLKALKPGEIFHMCFGCNHRVCEDCASYLDGADDKNKWRCSVCRRKSAPRRPTAQESTDSMLDVPVLEALQRRHSEARLGGGGGGGGALAPPRSPELRRHSDVSPASLKELEKLKAGVGGKGAGEGEMRRGSGGTALPPVPTPAPLPAAAASPRRRSVRMPVRQNSCDDGKQGQATPAAAGADAGLTMPAPMPRRASAYDVYATGPAPAASPGPRRGSYRELDAQSKSQPQLQQYQPQQQIEKAVPPKGLVVDEDRPLRRRGSQLPDIAALQRGVGGVLGSRVAEVAAAESAALAAARQLSVDGEAIKIVIHDVDDATARRVFLRRDPTDKGHRTRGFGMRVVGGKPGACGRREAVVVWTVPGGPADIAGLSQGDKVLEWAGVQLADRSFEEVCGVIDRSGSAEAVELLVEPADVRDDDEVPHASTPPSLLIEPETDKSPASPTRRRLPKTPEPPPVAARERPPARAQLQIWYESELRKLVVALLAADDLTPRDTAYGYGDEPEAYARIRLLPSLENCPPVETDPASASCSPIWNATLSFGGLSADSLVGRALELTLWDACPGIDPVLIGECTLDIEKVFMEDRAVWCRLEEPRGVRSSGNSPRGSLTGTRALRRGEFASQRSVSDDVDSIGECATLLHPDHAWVAGTRRGSSQSETLEVEVYQLGKDFSRSLPGSRRSSFQQADKDGAGASETVVVSRRHERRRSSCVRRDPDEILRSLRAVKGELGRTLSLSGSTAKRTATGRKGSMWAAVPRALQAVAGAGVAKETGVESGAGGDDSDSDSGPPLGPGQLPPRTANLPPLHAEINLSIILIKGSLELEVSHARRAYGVEGDVPDTYVKCYLRDGERWLHKRKTRIVRRTIEPHFNQTLKYQASEALGRTLVVMLWQRCGGFDHNLALGGCEIDLDRLTLPHRTYGWYPLFPATSLATDEKASP